MIVFACFAAAPASGADNAAGDNAVGRGAKKVEGGVRAIGKSAEEIGGKAGRAAEGAVKDTGSALGKAWDDIVKGLKKAFK
ncbi:MAG: hypothetical protein ACM3NF_06260 [Gemmatimonadota bacterium]